MEKGAQVLAKAIDEVRESFPEYAGLSDQDIIRALTGVAPIGAVFNYTKIQNK